MTRPEILKFAYALGKKTYCNQLVTTNEAYPKTRNEKKLHVLFTQFSTDELVNLWD